MQTRLGVQHQTVGADVRKHGAHIVRRYIVAALQIGVGLGGAGDCQCAAGADTQRHIGVVTGGLHQLRDIVIDTVCHEYGHSLSDALFQRRGICYRAADIQRIGVMPVLQQCRRAGAVGIAHAQLDEETVHLRGRQHLRTGRAHGVLCCQHHKGRGQRMGHAVHRDLHLLHSLQQRRLGLAGGAVDLVRQHQVGHDSAGLIFQRTGVLIKHGKADDVGGHGVRRELYTPGRQTQGLGECLGQRGLAHTGHVLQQHMALCQDGQQHLADDLLLAQNDFVDLLLELLCYSFHFSTSLRRMAAVCYLRNGICFCVGVRATLTGICIICPRTV